MPSGHEGQSCSSAAAADSALGKSEAAGIYVSKQWPAGGFMIIPDDATGELLRVHVVNREFKFDLLG